MPINKHQWNIFEKVVSIPSAYTQEDPVGDETVLQNALWDMLEGCGLRLSKQVIDEEKKGSRFNIIAQKGAPIEETRYVVMVYVHTDTVKKKKHWTSIDYQLVRDGEFLRGIGAYDMKQGVMLLVDLLQTVELPDGVTLVGAFCCGEERDSDGIKKLMEWPHIGSVNVVLSPEIGSVGNDADGEMLEKDSPKDIIVARPGNVKSVLAVTAQDSHAYKTDVADGIDAWRTLSAHLKQRFNNRIDGSVRHHPDLGREFLRYRSVSSMDDEGEFESIATEVRSKIAVRIVSPTTIQEIRAWQQSALDELQILEHWRKYDLNAEFTESGMSYEPYVIRTDAPDAQVVFKAVAEHYGSYRLSPGQAVADGAFGHKHMNVMRGIDRMSDFNQYSIREVPLPDRPVPKGYVPWLDIGPLGQGAHKKSERVYEESLVRLIEFYHFYLEQYLQRYLGGETSA